MTWKRVLLIGVGVAVTVVAVVAFVLWPRSQTRYEVVFLPDLYGVRVTAHAINDRGQVVGVAEVQPGQWRIWLWDKDAGMQDLGPYPGPMRIGRLHLNNAGQIAGAGSSYAFRLDPSGARHILRPGSDEHLQAFPALVDPNRAAIVTTDNICIHDLNNHGRIVGYRQLVDGPRRGFIWSETTGMEDMALPGAVESVAGGINDFGRIVGSYSTRPGDPWTIFLWDPNTGVQDLGPTGVGSTHMCHINDRGFVVGRFDARGDKSTVSLWPRKGGLRRLCPDRRAAVQTAGLTETNRFLAVTHRERFVLREFSRRTDLDSYLWDPNDGFVEIARCLGRKDVIEFFAMGINNEGQIVGALRLKNEPNPLAVLLQPIPERADK